MAFSEEDLRACVTQAERGYYKLVLVVGPRSTGKTHFLRWAAEVLKTPIINVGLEAARKFMDMTARQRRLKAEAVIDGLFAAAGTGQVCVENTEILFEPSLHLNPLRLLENLSRNRTIIATWHGQFKDRTLIHAHPDHPEFFKESLSGTAVITLTDFQPSLRL
jgi:hypothetical protein